MLTLKRFASIGLALTLVVSACTAGGTATQPPADAPTRAAAPTKPAEPVVLRIGWGEEPDTLNPAYAFLAVSYSIFDLVYSSLVKEGADGKYHGDLAAGWEKNDDGTVWTFTLKDDLKFHDGTPLTAEDVAWSIRAIKDDPDGWVALNNYTAGFAEVTAVDARTVQITTEYPIANIEYRLSFLYTLYRKDFEGFTTPEDLQNFTNDAPIGSGPFKVTLYNKDQGVVILDANPDYHDGRPIIDQVIFQKFDNDDAQVQAFKVGDVDVLYTVSGTAYETVRGFPNTMVPRTASRAYTELIINSTDPSYDPAPTNPTGNLALKDPAVRQALLLAMNKQDLVDVVLQGLGKPEWSIIAPPTGGGFWHNPAITDLAFDLDQANQILDEAGYVKGADGVREKDDLRLEFRLQFDADSSAYPRIADLLKDWYNQVGIRVNPEAMDSDTLIVNTTGAGDFDLVIWGWGGGDPDPDFMLSIMTCGQFVSGGWSDSGYCNADYDQMHLEQQQAVDPAERQRIIYEMQEYLFRDLPYIVLFNEDSLQAYRSDRFTGFPDYEANPNNPLGLTSADVLRRVEPVR